MFRVLQESAHRLQVKQSGGAVNCEASGIAPRWIWLPTVPKYPVGARARYARPTSIDLP